MEWSFGGDAGVLLRKVQFIKNGSRKFAFFEVIDNLTWLSLVNS